MNVVLTNTTLAVKIFQMKNWILYPKMVVLLVMRQSSSFALGENYWIGNSVAKCPFVTENCEGRAKEGKDGEWYLQTIWYNYQRKDCLRITRIPHEVGKTIPQLEEKVMDIALVKEILFANKYYNKLQVFNFVSSVLRSSFCIWLSKIECFCREIFR